MPGLIAVIDTQRAFTGLSRIATLNGFSCIEISSWSQIAFSYAHSDFVQAELQGVPLQDFAAVAYSGTPPGNEPLSGPDSHFIRTERERALVAALVQANTRVINAGWYLSDNWTIQTPEYQMFKLAELGWPVANISWHLASGKGIEKGFHNSTLPKALVLVSRRRHYIVSVEGDARPEASETLLRATRDYLRSIGLDWILIGLSVETPALFTACGCGVILPRELPDAAIGELLHEVLGATQWC